MKRLLTLGLLLLVSAIPVFAQTTVVSGNVIDTGAQPWFAGSVVATFVPAPGFPGPYIWSGGPFNQNLAITATISSAGAYTMNVPSNTAMTPSGSKWTFTVNSGTTALNTGAQVTQTVGPGATLTLNFTPSPPIIQAGPGATAYVDASVTANTGQTYFQLNSVASNGVMRVCLTGNINGSCGLWGPLGSGGGGGGGSFATLIGGTNTQANMIVGTGATMSANGSGSISATTVPFPGVTGGTNVANLVIGSGGFLNFSGTGIINANTINSTTVPFNSAGDQVFLTLAPLVGSWGSIPPCLDSAGQHLNYNTSTHAFSCGISGGTAGSAAFNTITSGTNTQAAMLVGTGASIATTGSGTIAATSTPFAGVLGGANTGQALQVGNGSSITPTGTGVVNANELSLTTVPSSTAADQYLGTTASTTGFWAPMPNCLDAGGNHINYNTSTHMFTCGTTGGSAGSVSFSGITGSTNSSAAMIIGTGASLTTSGTGSISATTMLFSGLTTSTNTSATLTIGTGAVITSSGSGQINANFLSGTSVPSNGAADQVLLTTAVAVGSWAPIPSCLDTVGQHLNYNTGTHAFACGTTSSGGGGGAGNPGGVDTNLQINKTGTFAGITGFGVDNSTTPTAFNNPLTLNQKGDSCFSGPRPWIDITCAPYFARATTISSTASGSGTNITVATSAFQNNDTIVVFNPPSGTAPAIATPTGLTITPSVAASPTTTNSPVVSGLTGASSYTYTIFAYDQLGGVTLPMTPVTITNGNATLGKTQFAINSWNLLGNTLTFTTTVANNLPVGTRYHATGTTNNALVGVWAPISSATNASTFVTNNVPTYAPTSTSGTAGGNITVMAANKLSWTASTGGSGQTLPMAYGICAQRPGDGALHLIDVSYPSTPYTLAQSGITVTQFNDYGPTLTSNNPIPWWLSDANCTAVSVQNQFVTETVTGGGGTTALTITPALPGALTTNPIRLDNSVPIRAAAVASAASQTPLYIPPGGFPSGFPINTTLVLPHGTTIWQSGNLTANNPIIASSQVQWFGFAGAAPGQSFSLGPGPIVTCNAKPCLWATEVGAQGQGAVHVSGVQFKAPGNGLVLVVDSNWGEDFSFNTFQTGNNNNDNMGINVMIRPGAAGYTFDHNNFSGGPNQVIDQSWTPSFFADRGFTGCCGGGFNVGELSITNSQWNRRGLYYVQNGGDGVHISMHNNYGQGFITPKVTNQNINGFTLGQVDLDYLFHDTTSQATYEWLCNLNCSGGPGNILRLGFVNGVSQDAGTTPNQITGGGNQPIQNVVAGYAISGFAPNPNPEFTFNQGALHANFPFTADAGFTGVATPSVSVQNSGFINNIQAATLTGNQTTILPNRSGVNCITGMVDCLTMVDTGVANAYVGCPTVILTTLPTNFYFVMQMANANTGPSTINICSLGAIPIKKNGGTGTSVGQDLSANDIKAGMYFTGEYDGINIQAIGLLGNTSGGGVQITGSPAIGNLMCLATANNITNCSIGGDVSFNTVSGVTTNTVNSIQGVPVNTNNVQVGQHLQILPGPVYQNVYPGVNYNAQTGSYTVVCPGDRFGDVDFTGSAPNPAIITLPQALATTCTGFGAGFVIHNGGTVPVNLQATTSLIDGISGGTGVWIMPGSARFVYSDVGTPIAYHTIHIATGFGGINIQTTNYTAIASDNGKLVIMNCSAACVFTLPVAPPITGETQAGTRWNVRVQSNGSTLATISLNGLLFNGGATAPILTQYQTQDISTDGSNWLGSAPYVASTNITLTPATNGVAISAAGGASGPSIQTNGVANTTQTTLNFQTSTGAAVAGRITPRNPSAGNEQFDVTNIVGTDAGLATAATISTTSLQPVCSTGNGGVSTTSCVSGYPALTDGATVTWATASVPNANATLTFTVHGGTRTLNLTGLTTGGVYTLKTVQDATGGESLVGGTGCTWLPSSTITLSPGASAINTLVFKYDGTNCLIQSSPTPTLFVTGILDGLSPVTVTASTTATLGAGLYQSGYTFNQHATAATAVTYTLPTAVAGAQQCISNGRGTGGPNTGVLTLATSATGQFIVFTDGTLTATGGNITSGGAARDAACVVGIDSTHWMLYVQSGTWTKH